MTKFEKDFDVYLAKELDSGFVEGSGATLTQMKDIHPSMLWGLQVDFFDSVGLSIEIVHNWRYGHFWGYITQEINAINGYRTNDFSSRPEARKAALEEAIEIYNDLKGNTET